MAPTEQKRQKMTGSGQLQRLQYELSVKKLHRRQRFGGFGSRNGNNDRNGGTNGDSDSSNGGGIRKFSRLGLGDDAVNAAGNFKDGVSSAARKLGDFFNPTRKAAAAVSTTTDASTTTSTQSTVAPTTTSISSPTVAQLTPSATATSTTPPPTTTSASTPSAPAPTSTFSPSPVALPVITVS